MRTLTKSIKARAWEALQRFLPWNARVIYSQFGEDAILENITRHWGQGFYVDVGAFHPVALSNTYKLYLKGWRGIAIEARPEVLREFEVYRPRDIAVACCIGPEPRDLATLTIFKDAALTTLDEAVAEQAEAAGAVVRERLPVRVRTLNDVLTEHKPPQMHVDLLSIDIEGLDEAVLHSLDFGRFGPRLIVFERHGATMESAHELPIVLFLKSLEYRLITVCGPSFIMGRKVQ